jgi:hypothetical protein
LATVIFLLGWKILRRRKLRQEDSSLGVHSNSCSPENGRIRAVKFRPKICGRILFDLGEFRPMSSQKFANLGGNSPKSAKFRPKVFGAKFCCADSPIHPFTQQISPKKKNYCVFSLGVFFARQFFARKISLEAENSSQDDSSLGKFFL